MTNGISGCAGEGTSVSQYEVPDSSSLDIATDITIETWIRMDQIPSSRGRVAVFDNQGQYGFFYHARRGLQFSPCSNTYVNVPVVAGEWFHTAVVLGNGRQQMYFNGMEVSDVACSATMNTASTDGSAVLQNSPTFDDQLIGAIDNLVIWSRRRSQRQICTSSGIPTC